MMIKLTNKIRKHYLKRIDALGRGAVVEGEHLLEREELCYIFFLENSYSEEISLINKKAKELHEAEINLIEKLGDRSANLTIEPSFIIRRLTVSDKRDQYLKPLDEIYSEYITSVGSASRKSRYKLMEAETTEEANIVLIDLERIIDGIKDHLSYSFRMVKR